MASSANFIDKLLQNKYTLVTKKRLENLHNQCIKFKDRSDVSFVECGVAKGGCLALLRNFSHPDATVYGFDSFNKMPPLTKEDNNQKRAVRWVGKVMSERDKVDVTFENMNVNNKNTHIIEGYFEDTFPNWIHNIDSIAILRLDADWYKATKYCLDELYDKVITGGIIIIDDYGAYEGCRKAVDEFRLNKNITNPIVPTIEYNIKGLTNGTEVWWIK